MALNKSELLKCRGETGAKPINEILAAIVDESNIHDSKTQHITADETATIFDNAPVYHGVDKEFVISDDKGSLATTSETEV